jgi:UDP-N-acetylmuramate--alanine ligase
VPFYGTAILCVDDPVVRELMPRLDRHVVTYGLAREAEVRADAETLTVDRAGQEVDVWRGDERLGRLRLPQAGRHNLRNALAALAVGLELDVPFAVGAAALMGFAGVGRRCELHGEHDGVLVMDDYGHHPTEITATMEVARAQERPVTVLFQPHRYSRTRHFAAEFAEALAIADTVALLPVYAAGEEDPGDADSDLIATILAERFVKDATVLGSADEVPGWLDDHVAPGDLLLTLGAGDIGRQVTGFCDHLDCRSRA